MDESLRSDILNDLFFDEENSPDQTLDITGFFPCTQTSVICHNAAKVWNDMKSGEGKPLRLTHRKILRLSPTNKALSTGDIYDPRDFSPSFLEALSKNRILRPNPLITIAPLPETPINTLDARYARDTALARLYPDIYALPLSPSRQVLRMLKKLRRTIRRNRKKLLIATTITLTLSASLIILSVSAKNYVEHETIRQYNRLQGLKNMSNLDAFQKEAQDIQRSFELIAAIFAPFRYALDNNLYSNHDVHLAANVISGGKSISDAVHGFADLAVWALTPGPSPKGRGEITEMLRDLKLTDFLRKNKSSLEQINRDLSRAIDRYAQIESLGNPTLDATLQKNLGALIGTKKSLDFLLGHFEPIMTMLGDTKPQRYLILNQNRDELRANGGFPGSAIFVELYKGKIEKFEKRDIYDYDWKVYPYSERPPGRLVEFGWEKTWLRDANYYPDFRESAEKINFFFEKAGGASLDTVAVINQGIILDLLKKYGSVQIANPALTFDADNFSRTMSTLVEAQFVPYKKLDTGNTYQTPKELLFRFMESLGKKLATERDILGYLSILRENIANHEILMASRDDTTQAFLDSLGTTDVSWKGSQSNWIYPLFTSLSGNKSDRYMKRTFELKSEAYSGCTTLNHVRLTSDHAITVDEQLKTRKILYDFNILDPQAQERLMFIQGSGPNRQYIRFILPPGSKLVASSNQTATQEPSTPDYSNISLLVETFPMQSTTVGFDYTSTPANCQPKLEFHKQPGLVNYEVK